MSDFQLTSLEVGTLRTEVAKVLRREILDGRFKPGEKLVEATIADRLGVSRGPVREALHQLEEEGLVTHNPRRGATVTEIGPIDAREIYTLRAELEAVAVGFLTSAFSAETIAEMETCVKDMRKAEDEGDITVIYELDRRFHEAIVREAKHSRLHIFWSKLNSQVGSLLLGLLNWGVAKPEEVAGRHQLVLDAVKSGDRDKAIEAIREHYIVPGETLVSLMDKGPVQILGSQD